MNAKPLLLAVMAASLSLAALAQGDMLLITEDEMQGDIVDETRGDLKECGYDIAAAGDNTRTVPPPKIEIMGLPEGAPSPAPLHLVVRLKPQGSRVDSATLRVIYLREKRVDLTSRIKDRMKEGLFEEDVRFPKGKHRIFLCVRAENSLPSYEVRTFEVK
jgi:hypothetical protein